MSLDLPAWFDRNVEPTTRTIYLGSIASYNSEFDTSIADVSAELFIKGLHVLEAKNSKPITILMNSPGGDWYHGMAIYDAIKCSPCKITIRVYGHAMSMGSVILQAADHRIMMPRSRFMIHYGYEERSGHSKVVYKWADEGKKVNYEMENIYLDRMLELDARGGEGLESQLASITNSLNRAEIPLKSQVKYKFSQDLVKRREQFREVLQGFLNYDTFFTPEQTVALGLADSVFYENK